jgi:hypothetical protein
MSARRGYDDNDNLNKMAAGLTDGTFTSVHQAARLVLDEPGGPNVDRLRRKFREMQRSNDFDTEEMVEVEDDPSDWWKLRLLDFPPMAKMTVLNVIAFLRSPAGAFRKACAASTPLPLMLLLIGLILLLVPSARLAFDVLSGAETEVLPTVILGIFFSAICINGSAVFAAVDVALSEYPE